MDALRNILVLMEPGSETQPAFDAALTLAQRFGARLELLMSDYQDLHAAYFSPPSATAQEFQDAVMSAHRAVLEKYVHRAEQAGVPPSARRCGARRFTRSCSVGSPRRSPTSW